MYNSILILWKLRKCINFFVFYKRCITFQLFYTTYFLHANFFLKYWYFSTIFWWKYLWQHSLWLWPYVWHWEYNAMLITKESRWNHAHLQILSGNVYNKLIYKQRLKISTKYKWQQLNLIGTILKNAIHIIYLHVYIIFLQFFYLNSSQKALNVTDCRVQFWHDEILIKAI